MKSRGHSLIECLAATTIVGLLVVAVAPVQTFLIRSWGAALDARVEQTQLALAVRQLERDARQSGGIRGGSGRFTLAPSIEWRATDLGTTRRSSDRERSFADVTVRLVASGPRWAEFELVTRGGASRRIAVHLRNVGSR